MSNTKTVPVPVPQDHPYPTGTPVQIVGRRAGAQMTPYRGLVADAAPYNARGGFRYSILVHPEEFRARGAAVPPYAEAVRAYESEVIAIGPPPADKAEEFARFDLFGEVGAFPIASFLASAPLEELQAIARAVGEEVDALLLEDRYPEVEAGYLIRGLPCTVSYSCASLLGWSVWSRGRGTIASGRSEEEAVKEAAQRLEEDQLHLYATRGDLTPADAESRIRARGRRRAGLGDVTVAHLDHYRIITAVGLSRSDARAAVGRLRDARTMFEADDRDAYHLEERRAYANLEALGFPIAAEIVEAQRAEAVRAAMEEAGLGF